MAYLYAGLGVALLIPLMAMVQTLVGLTSLESELASSRSTQQRLIANSLNTFGYGLHLAMNKPNSTTPANPLFTDQLQNDPAAQVLNKKACNLLPMGGLPHPHGTLVSWHGTYPDCAAVFAIEDLNSRATRYLRVEMLVDVAPDTNFPLGKMAQDPNTPRGGVYDVPSDALRINNTCWTPFGFDHAIEKCSQDDR